MSFLQKEYDPSPSSIPSSMSACRGKVDITDFDATKLLHIQLFRVETNLSTESFFWDQPTFYTSMNLNIG